MDVASLSRLQFAVTTIYHFFFVPLTVGLVWYVVILETAYALGKGEVYKRLAQFWGKLFAINFALGVVTGIVLEFQFGMNWSPFAGYIGDVFGVPLAMEALLTFFLESTFLGIWIFGWKRLSRGIHAAAIGLVAVGSTLSVFWILTANAFMQHPVGYVIRNGRAELVDILALVTNPRALLFFWHTISAGFVTASFFVLGISAWHLARGGEEGAFRYSFRLSAIIGILATVMVVIAGDAQSKYVREVQPMAAAASEGLMNTADPAPFCLLAVFDSTGKKVIWSIDIPAGLSLLYYLQPSGTVEGINQLQEKYSTLYGPGDYSPLVALDYWMFRIMVGVGFLMVALTAYALYLGYRKTAARWPRWMRWAPWGILLPYLANTTGWILTENGRQPWIVHGLLKTEDAVSPNLVPGMVIASLLLFVLFYTVLLAVDIYLLARSAKMGLPADESGPASASLPQPARKRGDGGKA
ncbi:MAG: cytochrome ubiquinol oxidase subunit I [Anaerolineales bacterium]